MSLAKRVGPFGTMGERIREKLASDNDARVLVVGADSQTGIGKTTFAISLCRYLDRSGQEWSAKDNAFIDVSDYISAHMSKPEGSCLMLDEIEAGADSRRAMSHDNVQLSQAWATMRAMNIATVATLPSVSMLDNRMLELCDYWVLVKSRGVAQPYEVSVNDFNGKVQRKPLSPDKKGNGEHIKFGDLDSDDPDKSYLDSIKDDMLRGLTKDSEKIRISECEERVQDAEKDARMEFRNEMIYELYHSDVVDVSTTDLGEMEFTEVSQSQASRITNNYSPGG